MANSTVASVWWGALLAAIGLMALSGNVVIWIITLSLSSDLEFRANHIYLNELINQPLTKAQQIQIASLEEFQGNLESAGIGSDILKQGTKEQTEKKSEEIQDIDMSQDKGGKKSDEITKYTHLVNDPQSQVSQSAI